MMSFGLKKMIKKIRKLGWDTTMCHSVLKKARSLCRLPVTLSCIYRSHSHQKSFYNCYLCTVDKTDNKLAARFGT